MAVLALAVAGCAETGPVVPTIQPGGRVPAPGPAATYKVGDPYVVDGVWYYPKVDYAYSETGIASWYGPGFDGRRTANGEIYDQNALSAAHPTLPLPSMVRVTNLDNGRSIKVRVNDRGPFRNGRIIDLSRRAAELLGFHQGGTAKVRVEIVEDESRRLAVVALREEAERAAPDAAPVQPVDQTPLAAAAESARAVDGHIVRSTQTAALAPPVDGRLRPLPLAPQPDGIVSSVPVGTSQIFVQAGAFTRMDNAIRLRARLISLGEAHISSTLIESRRFFRVRFGPMGSVDDADRLLEVLLHNGHTDARVVVD